MWLLICAVALFAIGGGLVVIADDNPRLSAEADREITVTGGTLMAASLGLALTGLAIQLGWLS